MKTQRAQIGPRCACWSVLVSLSVAACGGGESTEPSNEWRGSIATDGTVTTIMNEGGQLWQSARLVEEMSIGRLEGDDAYVFANVRGLALDDQQVYVLDRPAATVRVYDRNGEHRFNIGGPGEGPGEFRAPTAIGLGDDNRFFVRDIAQQRMSEFSRVDGELLRDWSVGGAGQAVWQPDGKAWVFTIDGRSPTGMVNWAMVLQSESGPGAKVEFPPTPDPAFVSSDRRGMEMAAAQGRSRGLFGVTLVPFAPLRTWAFSSSGELVLGEGGDYLFWRRALDGSEIHIRRSIPAAQLLADEARWYRGRLMAFWREIRPDFVFEAELPATKRALLRITLDDQGRAWVLRELEGARVSGCDENPADLDAYLDRPCWRQPHVYDVFAPEGRFLGAVEVPGEWRPDAPIHVRGDELLAVAEDDAGAIMVKRYRLITE